MIRALRIAYEAAEHGDVPVGALVLDSEGHIIGRGHNRREVDDDPTAHAEIIALRQAGRRLGTWNLSGCTLVVTLEPCTMCAGAIVNSRIDRLVFGAWDDKAGACGSVRDVVRDARLNHEVEVVSGIMAEEAAAQLSGFFISKRGIPGEEHWARPRPITGGAGSAPSLTSRIDPVADSPTTGPVPQLAGLSRPAPKPPTESVSVQPLSPRISQPYTSRTPRSLAKQEPGSDLQISGVRRRADRHRGKPVIPPLRTDDDF